MSTFDNKQIEETTKKTTKHDDNISLLPNLSHVNVHNQNNENDRSSSHSRIQKETKYINLNIDKKFVDKLRLKEQIYFASIAPLRKDHIDVHCSDMKDVQLHYCCGLYMPISSSFTVYNILSAEFMTSLKKLSLLLSPTSVANNNNNNNNNNNINNNQNIEHKQEDNSNISSPPLLERGFSAYQPSDHYKFRDLNKRIIVYVPGQQYASNEFTAAESILNECLHFCVDFPYPVIPFIWPSEGSLLSYDASILAEQYCANELNEFIRRIWSLYEWIDVIGHGRGCNILLRAMQILMREKPEVITDTHVICIAPDMESHDFLKHVQTLRSNIRRVTLYTNTWDWKLFSSKWWNWTRNRAGASILSEKGLDTIDTTELLAGWFGSNHYYLTNEYVQKDIIQALSEHGGLDPKYRNYVLPTTYTPAFSFGTQSPISYYILTDAAYNKPKYQYGNPNPQPITDNKKYQRNTNKNNENLQENNIKGYVQVLDDLNDENDNIVKQ